MCAREEPLKRARQAATASRSRSVNGSGRSLAAGVSSVKVIMPLRLRRLTTIVKLTDAHLAADEYERPRYAGFFSLAVG